MSQDTTNGLPGWKIQEVDEIVPTWVRIQEMLVSGDNRCMKTEIMVDASHFKGAIAKRRESALNGDKSAFWGKILFVEGGVETERTERKDVENRLLTHRFTRRCREEEAQSDQKL